MTVIKKDPYNCVFTNKSVLRLFEQAEDLLGVTIEVSYDDGYVIIAVTSPEDGIPTEVNLVNLAALVWLKQNEDA